MQLTRHWRCNRVENGPRRQTDKKRKDCEGHKKLDATRVGAVVSDLIEGRHSFDSKKDHDAGQISKSRDGFNIGTLPTLVANTQSH